jgi:hypothetical protein
VHKEINILFPEKGLTFAVISCIIRYTPKEGNSQGSKKSLRNSKETLDKLLKAWYNKNVPREGKPRESSKEFSKLQKKCLTNRPTCGIINT